MGAILTNEEQVRHLELFLRAALISEEQLPIWIPGKSLNSVGALFVEIAIMSSLMRAPPPI